MGSKDFYVYQLVDPRNGAPFYVGKGQKYRAWAHLNGKSHNPAVNQRIAEIAEDGCEAKVEIIRYFETDGEAIDFECTMICATDGLVNVLARGWKLTPQQERLRRMAAKEREFIKLGHQHKSSLEQRIAELSKFETFGLLDLPEEKATKIIKQAIAAAQGLVDRWNATFESMSHAT